MNASAGQRGPSLSAALHLVRAYQLVAQCAEETPTSACRRARQLQETFESTAPLLLRQRVEDIWAADCRNVSQGTVLAWVQDFPAPQAAASSGDFSEVARAVQAKLFTCFLGDSEGDAEPSFHAWLDKMLPSPKALDSHSLPRVDDIRAGTRDDTPLDVCGRAVRALQRVAPAPRCVALPTDVTASHRAVGRARPARRGRERSAARLRALRRDALARAGRRASPGSFARPPTADTILTLDKRAQETRSPPCERPARTATESPTRSPPTSRRSPGSLAASASRSRGPRGAPIPAPARRSRRRASKRPPPSAPGCDHSCRATRRAARSASPMRAASDARRLRGARSTTAT